MEHIYGKLGGLLSIAFYAYCDMYEFHENKKLFCLKRLITDQALAEDYDFAFKMAPPSLTEDGDRTSLTINIEADTDVLHSEDSSSQCIADRVEWDLTKKLRLHVTKFLEYSETRDAKSDWRKSTHTQYSSLEDQCLAVEKWLFMFSEPEDGTESENDDDDSNSDEDDEDASSSSDESE